MSDDWQDEWQPMIDAVGKDFGGGVEREAIDAVELGAVRKYLEPLEMDCPLYYDEAVAKEHGYRGVLVPQSGIATWLDGGVWRPGEGTRYPTADRNAAPHRDMTQGGGQPTERPPSPKTSQTFATDIEIEFFEPVVVGDRLTSRGDRLISCVPKETRVGRGAFIINEMEIHNQRGELVAKFRRGLYQYNPHQS